MQTSVPLDLRRSSHVHVSAAEAGGLARRLRVWSAAAAAVGLTIGSGIFRVPGVVAAESRSVGGFPLVWVLGGVITLCGALTVAELAAAFPRAGGIYSAPNRRAEEVRRKHGVPVIRLVVDALERVSARTGVPLG